MIFPEGVRTVAARRFAAGFGRWAADPAAAAAAELAMGLKPPTEAAARGQLEAVRAWADSWREAPGGIEVEWEDRRWSRVGGQRLPVRCRVQGAAALAALAGESGYWRALSGRAEALRGRWLTGGADAEALTAAIRREARAIAGQDAAEWERLHGDLAWLDTHPDPGAYIRQLPIRGVDTKWVGTHRSMVERLHTAITGRESLGVRKAEQLIRLRLLDPALRAAVGGIAEMALPVGELAALGITPATVLVCENLESVVAMEDLAGVVAVHGSGYAVSRLGLVPWLRETPILYWGDLDSNGFAILHEIRGACPDVTSVLMDTPTLEAHRDLWVHEDKPNRSTALSRLTAEEQRTLKYLRDHGDPRLEQERIAWSHAMAALTAAHAARRFRRVSSGPRPHA
jgi:hypothetical protein